MGDTLSHLAMHSSCAHQHPRRTEMFCLEYLEIGVSVSSDGLLILPKALVAYLIKVISVLVPSCMTGRFIATSSKKSNWGTRGVAQRNFSIAGPNIPAPLYQRSYQVRRSGGNREKL